LSWLLIRANEFDKAFQLPGLRILQVVMDRAFYDTTAKSVDLDTLTFYPALKERLFTCPLGESISENRKGLSFFAESTE